MMPAPHPDDAHPFAPFLQPGEELLWVGRPNAEAQKATLKQSLGAIAVVIFGVFVIVAVPIYIVEGIHTLLAAVVIFCGFCINLLIMWSAGVHSEEWKTQWLALTNKRLLSYRLHADKTFTFLSLENIVNISLDNAGNGCSNVRCHVQDFTKSTTFTLKAIEDATALYEQIQMASGRSIPIVEKR